MPIFFWTKERAILLTKAAKYIVPGVIAGVGAIVGFFTGKRLKKRKEVMLKKGKESKGSSG